MNMNLIRRLVRGQKPLKRQIQDLLYEVCDDEHSSCNENCPVYALNCGPVNPSRENCGCACFKSGQRMYDFIKANV